MSTATSGLAFGARNEAYRTFRITYPEHLFDIIDEAGANMRRRLAVDLGSGTGISTKPLLERFERVVAVEPDSRMAEKIERNERLLVEVRPSEELEIESRSVDLITSATAFYWMDGPKVIQRMSDWLHEDGLVAVYRYALPVLPDPLAILIDREFQSHWNVFRNQRLLDEEYSWRCFQESNLFKNKDRRLVANRVSMNWRTFVGFFGSTSYVGAYLRSIDNPESYIGSLEEEVRGSMGEDAFSVDFPTELILASAPQR